MDKVLIERILVIAAVIGMALFVYMGTAIVSSGIRDVVSCISDGRCMMPPINVK